MTPMEVTYRAYIDCLNERRWGELGTFLHSDFAKNGKSFTPEGYATELQANGETELKVHAVTVEERSQKIASVVLMKWKPSRQVMGFDPPGKPILFVEQHLNSFLDGKLSKTMSIADRTGIHRQLSDPQVVYTPDPISTQSKDGATRTSQSTTGNLELVYREYLDCINERTMGANWERFVHPQVIYDGITFTLDEYRQMMDAVIDAVPDLNVDIHTIIADDKAQRVAVRLESSGTPTKSLAGIDPSGSQSRFAEHLTYQFRNGKIARVWSLADWGSYNDLMSK